MKKWEIKGDIGMSSESWFQISYSAHMMDLTFMQIIKIFKKCTTIWYVVLCHLSL